MRFSRTPHKLLHIPKMLLLLMAAISHELYCFYRLLKLSNLFICVLIKDECRRLAERMAAQCGARLLKLCFRNFLLVIEYFEEIKKFGFIKIAVLC